MKRHNLQKKHLSIRDRNARNRLFCHNVIPLAVWVTGNEGKYFASYDRRCNWCKRSYWWINESRKYPRFCNGCEQFLNRLEDPRELQLIRNEDYGDIPF